MAVRFTVHADTEPECAAALDELCARLGAAPALRPVLMSLDTRWLARAVLRPGRERVERR